MSKIYLDYAATTPIDKNVSKAMTPYFSGEFGNASSIHSFGQEAIKAVDEARDKIAEVLNCNFEEIIFTGSATEANNLAILGIKKNSKSHIVSTNIEHESVLEPLKELKKLGHQITYLKADKNGFVSASDLKKSIKSNSVLASVMYANNEIGAIQPVKKIGKEIEKINRERQKNNLPRIYFHIDAVQALNYLECRPDWLKADLMTFSGHKIYGPKGIGFLFVRKGTPMAPIILGGGQEFGLRSGTENVPYIVGLGKAVEMAVRNREKNFKKTLDLRNQLLKSIIKYCEKAKINGSLKNRLPNNINLEFSGANNETMIVGLDQNDLAVSAGSACSTRAMKVSHVLTAIGLSDKQARESVRITLGNPTRLREIKKASKIIKTIFNSIKNRP